uniref:Uncharacterized protein n=1 Tax=Haemonchus contortus TaxID=6289 RepID=A0A7I4YJH8_HAECO
MNVRKSQIILKHPTTKETKRYKSTYYLGGITRNGRAQLYINYSPMRSVEIMKPTQTYGVLKNWRIFYEKFISLQKNQPDMRVANEPPIITISMTIPRS